MGRAPIEVHPVWKVGQYVTYLLNRDDGSWAAIALQVVGQSEDGSWALQGSFKTRSGESVVLFRSHPGAPVEELDLVPVQQVVLRRNLPVSDDPRSLLEDPMNITSVAMNVLMVRRWKAAAKCLSKEPRVVQYPCGIDRAHLLVTPGPGYQKHHDLCARVLLTGVACLSIDGGRNPLTVTSFGLQDPNPLASSPEDFVDLSSPKCIDHETFTMTYPATWFLLRMADEEDGALRMSCYTAHVGGCSCSVVCRVRIYSGPRERVRETREATRARFSGPLEGLSPREGAPLRLSGDALGTVHNLIHDGIDGVVHAGAFSTDGDDRFALVTATGTVSKANPRRAETLAAYDRVFRESVESFRLN